MTNYVVSVQPGSAVERTLRFTVSEGDLGSTVQNILDAGLGRNLPRDQKRTADAIRAEMKGQYSITANGTAIAAAAVVRPHFQSQPVPPPAGQTQPTGQTYMALNLIVAGKQTGGYQ